MYCFERPTFQTLYFFYSCGSCRKLIINNEKPQIKKHLAIITSSRNIIVLNSNKCSQAIHCRPLKRSLECNANRKFGAHVHAAMKTVTVYLLNCENH